MRPGPLELHRGLVPEILLGAERRFVEALGAVEIPHGERDVREAVRADHGRRGYGVAMTDARRFAPASERNRGPILEVARRIFPKGAQVLEIASGSGQHAAFLAPQLGVRWQPSDIDPGALASIDAWCRDIPEVSPAIELDCTRLPWPVTSADVVFCVNMIHIAPPRATEGLVAGAASVLGRGGILFLYGPYKRGGVHTAESNARFDESLRSRNPEWGVRDLDDVVRLAAEHGLSHRETVEMPLNNLSVVFERS